MYICIYIYIYTNTYIYTHLVRSGLRLGGKQTYLETACMFVWVYTNTMEPNLSNLISTTVNQYYGTTIERLCFRKGRGLLTDWCEPSVP